MTIWSRLAGEVFIDWLAPPAGMRWIDIGCGNGAFTELLVSRVPPRLVRAACRELGLLTKGRTVLGLQLVSADQVRYLR